MVDDRRRYVYLYRLCDSVFDPDELPNRLVEHDGQSRFADVCDGGSSVLNVLCGAMAVEPNLVADLERRRHRPRFRVMIIPPRRNTTIDQAIAATEFVISMSNFI